MINCVSFVWGKTAEEKKDIGTNQIHLLNISIVFTSSSPSVPARIRIPLSNVTVYKYVGKAVTLQCVATGYPDVHLSWHVNGTLLQNQSRTFSIRNVTEHHQEWYTCRAKNEYGVDNSRIWLQPLGECHFIIVCSALHFSPMADQREDA